MNFKDFYLISEGEIYKTTYQSDMYGGDHTIGLTIEFLDLKKYAYSDGNTLWSWDLMIDNTDHIHIFRELNVNNRIVDGGCYHIVRDEEGITSLGDPEHDPERIDVIDEYIKEKWPLEKREAYIKKEEIKKGLKGDATETWDGILG